jgi:L,D-transpeptidase catalytic domain
LRVSGCFPPRQTKRVIGRGFCVLLGAALMTVSPAAAKSPLKHQSGRKEADHAGKEPFGQIPKGPLQIFISVNQQKLHLYSDGAHIADAPVATGVPDHPTPLGVFSVIAKNRYHESNIYSAAPMPYMQRITWSGIALHEGVGVGHPASHGCIRMPHGFAVSLWALTRLGARVIIARSELRPTEFADSHLFVHKETPSKPAAAAADAVKTRQTDIGGKTTDAEQSSMVLATAKISMTALDAAPKIVSEPAKVGSVAQNAPKLGPSMTVEMTTPAPAIAPQDLPMPIPKPAKLARSGAKKTPISIFVSRRRSRIYVRQNLAPLFEAPVTIERPEQALGTHVFTAMEYLADGSAFRWNVVSLPGEQPELTRKSENAREFEKHATGKRKNHGDAKAADPPPDTPGDALARIEIPQDVIDQISALIVPGSSLVVSDQGLGEETGEGTDFIVVTR